MAFNNISRHDKCDFLKFHNDVERLGFDKNYTEIQMIGLALEHKCPVIIKNGKRGKWYLKGKGRTGEYLTSLIKKNEGREREGVYCLFIQ